MFAALSMAAKMDEVRLPGRPRAARQATARWNGRRVPSRCGCVLGRGLTYRDAHGEMRGTTAASRSRRVRRRCLSRSSGDRAVPYTVPMKAVQPQCCTSGAIPSSTFGCVPKDGYGSLSPLVPVRALPRAGHAVFPLRSRPGVLQPIVLARRPPRAPSAQRPALPGQPRRQAQACSAHGLLASTSTLPVPGQHWRRRQ